MTNPTSHPAGQPSGQPKPAPKEPKNAYRDTLNLPQTAFPMKANLVQNEPASLARWRSMGLYARLRQARAGSPRFVFHDGPPYANASIHTGHMMNKCLKDFVVRSRTMAGADCPYVPGWDCHGLPIEHKVAQELVEKGKAAKLATLPEDQRRVIVRRECKAHAEKFHKLHTTQMERLLTLADYENPYLTMAPRYEASTLEVLAGLLERGLVYRALKPVHWSPANETALADAELEYHDREDPSIYVDFEAADADAVYNAFGLHETTNDDEGDDADDAAEGAEEGDEAQAAASRRAAPGRRPAARPSFMIWTTTPWTLPANLAIAVNPLFEYALVWVDGNVSVMAKDAVERVTQRARSEEVVVIATTTGDKLLGLRYRHPFVDRAPAFPKEAGGDPANCYKLVQADYVTLEDGTGLVHTAPGHGAEDYQTGLKENIPVYCPVLQNGCYDASVPDWLRGVDIWKANPLVIQRLRNSGHMFHDHVFTHSYPHDWRSKTPVIFRCTEQWFVSVDGRHEGHTSRADTPSLRAMALAAVDENGPDPVRFVPEWGRNRLRGMLESRPDWCISRQRAWGLPIPAFELPGGACFMTPASVRAIAAVFAEKGSDAWFTDTPAQLLHNYNPASDPDLPAELRASLQSSLANLKKGGDILDVWFEAGSSWNSVMRARGLGYPADLYLEGSDQHRGWFQLSLLPALGVTGQPPFRTLLTHGFVVDKEGKKLSKSRPDAHLYEVDRLFADFGSDVLRWWVSSLAYENDVKMDRDFIDVAGESYRKVRNTLRFMLSNLYDFTPAREPAPPPPAPESLDAWALGEFDRLRAEVLAAYERYDFRAANAALYDFCNATLSAGYLAAVKDRLYCDRADAPRRRAAQATLFTITDGLCRLLAPVLCHTADEAFRALHKADAADTARCVHLELFPPASNARPHQAWARFFQARDKALPAMEKAKADLGVENPLDMGLVLPDPEGTLAALDPTDLADVLGVSRVSLDRAAAEPRVADLRAEPRCERSWKRDGTVKRRSDGGMLSDRDAAALGIS